MPKQRNTGRKRRPRDTAATAINLSESTREDQKKYVLLDGGTVAGQVLKGDLVFFDQASQRTNLYWAQDDAFISLGGYVILDIDAGSQTITPDDIISVLGLVDSPTNPGNKAVGLIFSNPTYPAAVVSAYNGTVRFQNLFIPLSDAVPDDFYWPLEDAAAGSTLTTDGQGGLYWTPPAIPPNLETDSDVTDYFLIPTLTWIDALVSVTATKNSLSPSIAFECTLSTAFASQTVQTRMLINGTPTGQVFSVELPRNVDHVVHYNWSNPTSIADVITIENMHSGNQSAEVLGATNPTTLQLLEP